MAKTKRKNTNSIAVTAITDEIHALTAKFPNMFFTLGSTSGFVEGVTNTLKTLRSNGVIGDKVAMVNVADGSDPERVSSDIDALFENGPQATMTTSEAAFQAIFASMLGNVPLFLGTLGGAVLFAVLFSVINTMLIAARQRRREAGILQALGFSPSTSAWLLVFEGVLISLIGGGLGLLLAGGSAPAMAEALGTSIPNYAVDGATITQGILLALLMGILAGAAAGLPMVRLQPTEALRSEG